MSVVTSAWDSKLRRTVTRLTYACDQCESDASCAEDVRRCEDEGHTLRRELRRECQTPEERDAEEYFAASVPTGRATSSLLVFLILAGFASFLFAMLNGCGAAVPKPIVTDHVVTVTVKEKCAKPAPVPVPVPPPTACAAGFICYHESDYAALLSNVEALLSWAGTTVTECAK